MFHLLVASAIIAVALGSKCCTPDQWEGGVGEIIGSVIDGKTHVITGNLSMSYDYTNKKLATTSNLIVDDKPQLTTVILNYQTKMMYTIVDGACTTSQITGNMMQLCVPDNAIPTGKFTYGVGSNTLDAMGYMIRIDDRTHVYATTTPGNPCAPIGEVLYGTPNKIPTVQTLGYYDISAGIANPNVFTPPSSCKGQKMLKYAPELNNQLTKHIHSKFIKN